MNKRQLKRIIREEVKQTLNENKYRLLSDKLLNMIKTEDVKTRKHIAEVLEAIQDNVYDEIYTANKHYADASSWKRTVRILNETIEKLK